VLKRRDYFIEALKTQPRRRESTKEGKKTVF